MKWTDVKVDTLYYNHAKSQTENLQNSKNYVFNFPHYYFDLLLYTSYSLKHTLIKHIPSPK